MTQRYGDKFYLGNCRMRSIWDYVHVTNLIKKHNNHKLCDIIFSRIVTFIIKGM